MKPCRSCCWRTVLIEFVAFLRRGSISSTLSRYWPVLEDSKTRKTMEWTSLKQKASACL